MCIRADVHVSLACALRRRVPEAVGLRKPLGSRVVEVKFAPPVLHQLSQEASYDRQGPCTLTLYGGLIESVSVQEATEQLGPGRRRYWHSS